MSALADRDGDRPPALVDRVEVEAVSALLAPGQVGANAEQVDRADGENGDEADDGQEDVPAEPSASWRPCASFSGSGRCCAGDPTGRQSDGDGSAAEHERDPHLHAGAGQRVATDGSRGHRGS